MGAEICSWGSPLHGKILDLIFDAVRLLDQEKWEEWVRLFTEDGVYKIISRENFAEGLPLAIVLCEGRDMISDRILSLRKANIFNLHHDRHMVSNPRVLDVNEGCYSVHSHFALYQSTPAGDTSLFSVGAYLDKIIFVDDQARFKERIAVTDTGAVRNLLSSPI